MRFVIVVTQCDVIIAMNGQALTRCINGICVVGHERTRSVLYQIIVSIVWLLIYNILCGGMKCRILYKGDVL